MTVPHPTDVLALLESLIGIDSVNSDLVEGAQGEAEIASWCARWLTERGFAVHLLQADPRHPSLVAIARGSGGGRSLMLNGHIDTVGVAGYRGDPFAARVEGTKIFGRGAFDTKGGVAAIMVAAAAAAASPLSGDVLVTLVADEEFGSRGTEEVLAKYRADAAIVVEPTNLDITLAHRGFAWFEIELTGLAAHGSMPQLGVDAIAAAGRFFLEVDRLRERLESARPHPLLGTGTVRISTISGGTDAATVAPSCTLTLERRTLPGDAADEVESEIRSVLETSVGSIAGLSFSLRRIVARAAFEADPSSPVVRALTASAQSVLGRVVPVRGEPFWTDAGLVAEAGIPCLVFGADGSGAHADEEWADIESVRQLARILEGTIREFCA